MKAGAFVFAVLVIDTILAYIDLRVIPASWVGALLFIGIGSVAFMALTILLDKEKPE